MRDELLEIQEEQLREQINQLPTESKQKYYRTIRGALKDPDTYAVLNYCFICGLHHFYLNKPLFGVINLSAMLLGVLLWQYYGFVLILLIAAIELPQLFKAQYIVAKYNQELMQETLEQVQHEAQL